MEVITMKYEKLIETINVDLTLIDIICLTANLHLGVNHVDQNVWSRMFSKALGRRFVKFLIEYEAGVPTDILKEYQKAFAEE
jgi:hypothetical protein